MRDLDYTEEGDRLYRGGTPIIQRRNLDYTEAESWDIPHDFISLSLLPIQFPPLAKNPV